MFRTIKAVFAGIQAETEDAIFSANAIRILEQQTREVADAFETLKRSLAQVISLKAAQDRKVEGLSARISGLESQARSALDEGDDTQALALAGKIAVLGDERTAHSGTAVKCERDIADIRVRVNNAARRLAELRRGVATARSASALARAHERGAMPASAEQTLREAEASLVRIQEKHADSRVFNEALDDIERDIPLANEDYATAPHRAETTSAEDVLARLRRSAPPGGGDR